MKKCILSLLFAFLFALCGCTHKTGVKPVLQNVCFDLSVYYDKTDYYFSAEIENTNKLSVSVLKPETLKNTKITVDEDTAIAYDDINYKVALPQNSPIMVIGNVINEARKKPMLANENDNSFIKGNINGMDYTLTFSPSGIPLKLVTENPDLTATFYNFTLKHRQS